MSYGKANLRNGRLVPAARVAALAFAAFLLLLLTASQTQATTKGDRRLEVDYTADYVLLENYPLGETVKVDVVRGDAVIGTQTGETVEDPQGRASSVFEINHIGGGQPEAGGDCWAEPFTPDIKPGDKIVTTLLDGLGAPTADTDYTFVRDLTFEDLGGSISGHALGVEDGDGNFDLTAPISIGDPEAGGAFLEGRRVLDTLPGGRVNEEITPNPDGTFTSPLDGDGGEAFVQFVNPNGVGAGDESTVAGPADEELDAALEGCPALAQTAITNVNPDVINSGNIGGGMAVSGIAQDGISVALTVAGIPQTVNLDPDNGSWTANVSSATLQGLPEGSFDVVATFSGSGAPPAQTVPVLKDTIAPAITADPLPGTYTSARSVALLSDGAEAIRYSTDGNPPNANSRIYDGQRIPVNSSRTIRAFATDAAGNRRDASFAYVIRINTAPTINVLRPFPASATKFRRPLIGATVTDRQTNLAKGNMALFVDGRRITAFTYNRTTDRLSYQPPLLAFGRHSVRVVATDPQGLSRTAVWNFRVIR